MTYHHIIKQRLINQQIVGAKFKQPSELVKWFGGMQAQSYGYSKWAIGCRIPGLTDSDIEKSFYEKKIIRTWLMRGTLHLTAAEDIRWMLALLAPRLISQISPRIRLFGYDESEFTKSNKIFIKILRDGGQLTRDELADGLKREGINAKGIKLGHILLMSSLKQTICFGSRRGKQFTFVLLDKWVPESTRLNRDEALWKISTRYFSSHGPATLQDFVWWSGLSVADAKTGIASAGKRLISEKIDDENYWFAENSTQKSKSTGRMLLLPGFDEYVISYKNRNLCLNPMHASKVFSKNGIFNPVIINNGIVTGTWKPVLNRNSVGIATSYFDTTPESNNVNIISPAKKYAKFIGKTLKNI